MIRDSRRKPEAAPPAPGPNSPGPEPAGETECNVEEFGEGLAGMAEICRTPGQLPDDHPSFLDLLDHGRHDRVALSVFGGPLVPKAVAPHGLDQVQIPWRAFGRNGLTSNKIGMTNFGYSPVRNLCGKKNTGADTGPCFRF